MIFIILIVLCCPFFITALVYRQTYEDGDSSVYLIFFIMMTFLVVLIVVTTAAYAFQIRDIESLTQLEGTIAVYHCRSELLKEVFKQQLLLYIDHEQQIFQQISPQTLSAYATDYPELQAADTLIHLAEKINSLQDDIYQTEIEKLKTEANIRIMKRNPWVLTWFIPE